MITEALFKVLPVLLLLALGSWLSRRQFLPESTRADLKKLIVNVTLPAALFLAFLQVQLQPRLLAIPVLIFGANLLVFGLSRRLTPLGRWMLPGSSTAASGSLSAAPGSLSATPGQLPSSAYFPYLITGYEAGMLGYAIFAAVYGQENLYKFGLIDLGQVVFVFFVLIPSLKAMEGASLQASAAALQIGAAALPQASRWDALRETLLGFLKTPVILAILGGMALHQLGWVAQWGAQPWLSSLLSTLQLLAGMTTPLVALVIGAEIRFADAPLAGPARTTALRLLVWLPAALLFNAAVLQAWLGLDVTYQAAVLTMAILPAPFVAPLFMRAAAPEARSDVVNSLSLMTLVTLAAFVLVTILLPPV